MVASFRTTSRISSSSRRNKFLSSRRRFLFLSFFQSRSIFLLKLLLFFCGILSSVQSFSSALHYRHHYYHPETLTSFSSSLPSFVGRRRKTATANRHCHNTIMLSSSLKQHQQQKQQQQSSSSINDNNSESIISRRLLVNWVGESEEGYSRQFRHLEFTSALAAELKQQQQEQQYDDEQIEEFISSIKFTNALEYTGSMKMHSVYRESYNEAIQYIEFPKTKKADLIKLYHTIIISTVQRCSLVNAIYEIIAIGNTYGDIISTSLDNNGLKHMYKGEENENMSWCFRLRHYDNNNNDDDENDILYKKAVTEKARSITKEQEALNQLKDLLINLGGKVNLKNPDCMIYLFDGLIDGNDNSNNKNDHNTTKKVLTCRIAMGPKISSIAPKTRICITSTPLCPIAAFSLCNVARITNDSAILDPYSGSCATLLAASMIAPNCQTVGIEIASASFISRDDIRKDFSTRNLKLPNALLIGDCTDPIIRNQARKAIINTSSLTTRSNSDTSSTSSTSSNSNRKKPKIEDQHHHHHQQKQQQQQRAPFDAIIADPPYGLRESSNYNTLSPLEQLLTSIISDRDNCDNKDTPGGDEEGIGRLLKVGGRLVAFVPVTDEEALEGMLPSNDLIEKAGLKLEASREQPLNEKLSRWMVSFVCIR